VFGSTARDLMPDLDYADYLEASPSVTDWVRDTLNIRASFSTRCRVPIPLLLCGVWYDIHLQDGFGDVGSGYIEPGSCALHQGSYRTAVRRRQNHLAGVCRPSQSQRARLPDNQHSPSPA
jgi:hypothetical protein